MDGQILRRLKQIAKFVVFENLQVSLTVFQSLFYCAFHKHVNSKVQKLPLQFFATVNQNYNHKQRTVKHRNTLNGLKSTNHKLQTMTF